MNRRAVGMEPQAARIPWHAAMIEESPYLVFRFGNKGFVVHVVHAPRQHPSPMIHQFEIQHVVPAKILKIIGKRLPAAE